MVWVELTHALATVAMTAVIWFVQVVHYPLFARVGHRAFVAYEREHVRRISWIVMPLMLVELAGAVALATLGARGLSAVEAWVGVALLAIIWGGTFLVQVPLHRSLSDRFEPVAVTRLVRSNWLRTLAWTARAALVASGLARLATHA